MKYFGWILLLICICSGLACWILDDILVEGVGFVCGFMAPAIVAFGNKLFRK